MTQSMTNKEAHDASFIVAQMWAEDFADFLTVFDGPTVNRALFARFSTTHRESDLISYENLCEAFVDLYDRKVLVPEFSMSGIPTSQLQEMRDIVAKAKKVAAAPPPPPPVNPAVVAKANQERAIEECVADFTNMGSGAFKKKWFGTRRAVYDAVVASGRI